jgi:hypothetical protein
MAKVYSHIGALRPQRSVFNNSFTVQFNCDMGQIIPVYCEECVPGDRLTISMEAVVRFQPLITAVLHEIYLRTFYYFIPTRLLMDHETMDTLGDSGTWEEFITGGNDGKDTTVLPVWGSTVDEDGSKIFQFPEGGYGKYSLWDYFNFPLGVKPTELSMPLSFNKRAYNMAYNEYFRDQNLQDEVCLDSDVVQNIAWSKDRFTTALYDTQRGERPAIPLSGLSSVSFKGSVETGVDPNTIKNEFDTLRFHYPTQSVLREFDATGYVYGGSAFKKWLNNNTLNMSNAVTFDAMDMRRLFQLQKCLERNMRSGARYIEQVFSRFSEHTGDSRVQRPEFIGGTRSPIIISEVLQTSESTQSSAQGNIAGHGISAEQSRVGYYHCREHGYIIGLLCVQPVPMYYQGINRQWTRRTRWDFLTPELVNLSEIGVKNSELCVTGNKRDDDIFGFQGIYDEYRIKESRVAGDMRDIFSYWNLFRDDFDKDNPPSLNENFIVCRPSKRIFAVQNEPGLIINYGNLVRAVRPLPIIAEPGLIDHH